MLSEEATVKQINRSGNYGFVCIGILTSFLFGKLHAVAIAVDRFATALLHKASPLSW